MNSTQLSQNPGSLGTGFARRLWPQLACAGLWAALACLTAQAEVVFEVTSPYHNILVSDNGGLRVLSFDGTTQSRMSLSNPLQGHFEYTEYFHMPWLWNTQLTRVCMIGLGGGSTQRSYEHYYPQVTVETVEIDPMVAQVAREHFGLKESAKQKVHLLDGRVHLRRTQTPYDAILLDAYSENRYGSFIPYHLATKEFFDLANRHLTTNGIVAYNVMGTLGGWQADVLGSVYRTMASVFPQVYLFPAQGSQNVVLIATKSLQKRDKAYLARQATALIQSGRIKLPTFRTRLEVLTLEPPASFKNCQVLTDDFAPVDGLLSKGR